MPQFGYLKALLPLSVCLLLLTFTASAQERVATKSSLYCAGYVQLERFPEMPEIAGAEEEREQTMYAAGDIVYLNAGSRHGIEQDQKFQIIRPRGEVKGVQREKKGSLGTYVQEIGQLQIFKVREDTSVAQIIFTCDPALLGDLLAPIPERDPPARRATEGNLDRFANPSGKHVGRLMMAKDSRGLVTQSDVVYIDLGVEDNVKPGDYLTIYRYRPVMPRKIVGEMVVVTVQSRTATAIITRAVQEIHTGDWVEIQ